MDNNEAVKEATSAGSSILLGVLIICLIILILGIVLLIYKIANRPRMTNNPLQDEWLQFQINQYKKENNVDNIENIEGLENQYTKNQDVSDV